MREQLLQWYDKTARPLPWRLSRDPYAIWVSEIMLQQTRAETVVSYWNRFMAQYPTVQALAAAPEQDVLKAWEGLGYYSRARNLLRCSQVVCAEHSGAFPRDVEALKKLPGIGEYTAGAVASIAFGIRTPAIDGNVERVVSRLRGIREDVGIPTVKRRLRQAADDLVPADRPGDFNQAMMELGARVCQPAPRCGECPVATFCDAAEAGDADTLPIKQRKAPQRPVPRGVALVTHAGRVLLHRREERLLHGLWSFPGFENATSSDQVGNKLQKLGVFCAYVDTIGTARHVFTHLIWEMTLFHFAAQTDFHPPGWQWADQALLAALPLPTADRVARAAAAALLAQA